MNLRRADLNKADFIDGDLSQGDLRLKKSQWSALPMRT